VSNHKLSPAPPCLVAAYRPATSALSVCFLFALCGFCLARPRRWPRLIRRLLLAPNPLPDRARARASCRAQARQASSLPPIRGHVPACPQESSACCCWLPRYWPAGGQSQSYEPIMTPRIPFRLQPSQDAICARQAFIFCEPEATGSCSPRPIKVVRRAFSVAGPNGLVRNVTLAQRGCHSVVPFPAGGTLGVAKGNLTRRPPSR
jgi:hypothetical protein